ncbi:amidase [Methylocystis bryophila]|uniref:Amidase n=1 Tax=Methylocystis bryophila TaxID=655015 RepID=A0A1W6MYG4_9HYPH|nr:amidase [Methylocystis bryophila]ARN82603.1 amidase [Methylocystis bryophila]BDV38818.1 amidase [Methylocystis bryophila]
MSRDLGAFSATLDLSLGAAGPLAGLAFVVKENIDVEGLVSTNGHPEFAASHMAARANAPVVEALLAAGATLVGKTHMDEMAYSLMGANAHYGTPVNGRAPDRHPGGSSSGSAAVVAAGLADFALGTDTAGSCRAPASFCGVFGFRPSHDALSLAGIVPLAPSFDVVGFFARDAATLAKVGDILLPQDPDRRPLAQGLVLADVFADCPQAEGARFVAAMTALAPELPMREVALDASFWPQALTHFRNYQAFEAWRSHGAWIEQRRPGFGPGIGERFAYAATVTQAQRLEAEAFREEARPKIEALLGEDGLLVLPTTPFFAPRLDESAEALDAKRYQMFRLFLIASFFGLPQVSLPLASDPPLGLSLIGRRGTDRALLALASGLAPRVCGLAEAGPSF